MYRPTFIYAMQTAPVSKRPKRGKATTGIKLVMGRGSASVIQKIAIMRMV